jgi:eukaryotic-like serine/threonine-protein kinase
MLKEADAVADKPDEPAFLDLLREIAAAPTLRPLIAPDTPGAIGRFINGATQIGGRYEVLGYIGAGGMGTVYRVRDLQLDEVVALKLLRGDPSDQDAIVRFRREVKLARRVTHRNVARTFDIGEHGREWFLTMEYVEGESLAELLARDGTPSLARTLEIAHALCEGLDAAHRAGVVHRDLKPQNVLLERGGRVVITDFGIAYAADHSDSPRGAGTPLYMAPEQVEGLEVDARADLYALGALLYELLTGAAVWAGTNALAVATARLLAPPPDPRATNPQIPVALGELVQRCMARKSEARPQSAREIAVAIETLMASITQETLDQAPAAGSRGQSKVSKTVAVIAFRGEVELGKELAEDLLDRLSMVPGLRVKHFGATASERDERDAGTLGRALDVDVVVEGMVSRADDQARLAVRAIGVDDGFQIWAQRFDGAVRDLFAFNDRAANGIAAALTVDWRGPERRPLADTRAVELYVEARQALRSAWGNFGSRDALPRAVALFDQAVTLAPTDPCVLSGAAMAHARFSNYQGHGDHPERARRFAERAMQLGVYLGEPWLAVATVDHIASRWPASVRALVTAIDHAPGLIRAHELLGSICCEIGAVDIGRRHLDTALSLDASATYARLELARSAALRGNWDRVESLLDVKIGNAVDVALRAMTVARFALWRGSPLAIESGSMEDPNVQRWLAPYQAAFAGREVDLAVFERSMIEARSNSRFRTFLCQQLAELAAHAGDRDRAQAAIDLAVDAMLYDLAWLDGCPLFASIRSDPKFIAARATVASRAAAVAAALTR